MPHPFIAAVTFNHFPVRNTVSGGAEGTGYGAAFTADTVGIIINSKPCFRILAQASCRTGVYAGSVRTVHAGSGQVDAGIAAVRLFYLLVKGSAVTGTACRQVNIILVHASHHTGRAGTAFIRIKYKNTFHHFCHSFRFAQGTNKL